MGDGGAAASARRDGRGVPEDLLGIRNAINCWEQIRRRIMLERKEIRYENYSTTETGWRYLDLLLTGMFDLTPFATRVGEALSSTWFDHADKNTNRGEELECDSGFGGSSDLAPFGRPPYGGRWKLSRQ